MNTDNLDPRAALLSGFDQPCLLVGGEQVTFANDAAIELLGRHITGANVRLAIRAPRAIEAILGSELPSKVVINSIGLAGSQWELNCKRLNAVERLVVMQDLSAQQSIAKVHTDFVANASHELRTPLANILGYVETLKDAKAGDDAAVRSRFLDTIRREAERMQSLVSDLMSLSRIEAEKHRLPEMAVDLAAICNSVADEFSDNGNIVRNLPKGDHLIRGDEAQLRQMLRNLIDNAVKYCPAGTAIEIGVSKSVGNGIRMSVSDNGDGIAAEHLPRLTERFYRTDPGRSKAVGGTGLGLSIVKHIVSRHRGKLDIASEIGEGTTITIDFPPYRKPEI